MSKWQSLTREREACFSIMVFLCLDPRLNIIERDPTIGVMSSNVKVQPHAENNIPHHFHGSTCFSQHGFTFTLPNLFYKLVKGWFTLGPNLKSPTNSNNVIGLKLKLGLWAFTLGAKAPRL